MHRAQRSADDGYRHPLVPGLRSTADAQRLAAELAFASARLERLALEPPGGYGVVATEPDPEEALWLAFLIAYLGPLEGEDPFPGVRAAHRPWSSGELPDLDGVELGPRTAHDPSHGARTVVAYRAWAERAGSQQAAFAGEEAWTPVRRFARAFERLALPGLHRAARFDLLTTLGCTSRLEVRAGSLFWGSDEATVGAKRVFGIADPLLLDRRAIGLAEACEAPLESLDLALLGFQRGKRVQAGMDGDAQDAAVRTRAEAALEV